LHNLQKPEKHKNTSLEAYYAGKVFFVLDQIKKGVFAPIFCKFPFLKLDHLHRQNPNSIGQWQPFFRKTNNRT